MIMESGIDLQQVRPALPEWVTYLEDLHRLTGLKVVWGGLRGELHRLLPASVRMHDHLCFPAAPR